MSQAFDSRAKNMNNRLDKVIQAETLASSSVSSPDNHSRTEEKTKMEPHDISILERRVFALETFLGSSSNTLNVEAAGTQHGGQGSQEDSGTISASGTFPLIDNISRCCHIIFLLLQVFICSFICFQTRTVLLSNYRLFLQQSVAL